MVTTVKPIITSANGSVPKDDRSVCLIHYMPSIFCWTSLVEEYFALIWISIIHASKLNLMITFPKFILKMQTDV